MVATLGTGPGFDNPVLPHSRSAPPCSQGYSLWPALSRGHREEREQGPEHVVVVEFVLLPLAVPGLHFVLLVQEVLASVTESWLVSRAHHLPKATCAARRWAHSCPCGDRDPGLSVGVGDTDRMEGQI